MINKNTIENTWKQNPLKIYHVIQNPRIDIENKNRASRKEVCTGSSG